MSEKKNATGANKKSSVWHFQFYNNVYAKNIIVLNMWQQALYKYYDTKFA